MQRFEQINVDIKEVIKELLITLRGVESQEEVSKKLGYSYNKVFKWENGQNRIGWEEFMKYVRLKEIDLTDYFIDRHSYRKDIYDGVELFVSLIGSNDLDRYAHTAKLSRSKIYRMISGRSKIYLEDMLFLIFTCSERFIEFFDTITKGTSLKSLEVFYTNNHSELLLKYPDLAIVLRIFELYEYIELKVHNNLFIAEKLNKDLATIEKYIQILLENEMIIFKDNKYFVLAKKIRHHQKSIEYRRNCYYWNRENIQRYEKKLRSYEEDINTSFERCASTNLIFNIADSDLPIVKEAILKFKSNISHVATSSVRSSNSTYLLTVGLVDLLEKINK